MKIEELFVGAWVQELRPTVKKLMPPMRVVGLFKGGQGRKGRKGPRCRKGDKGEKEGFKNDRKDGKLRWELLPLGLIEKVVEVYHFGAEKYSPNSWQGLTDGYNRYKSAFFRHVVAFERGEAKDPESGLHHLAHAAWNALAMLYFGMKIK